MRPESDNRRVRIDLNADVAESFGRWRLGDDAALLPHLTSANVACGFHAGDARTIRETVEACATLGVVVGAQVSYRDLAGFGRRPMDLEAADLEADVLYQLAALDGIARASGTDVGYVKPHGALYNAAVTHEAHAQAVVDAVVAHDPTLPVLGLPGSALLRLADAAGLTTVAEGFADRGYTPQGTLVSRREPGALVEDAGEVAARAVRMVVEDVVVAVDGTAVDLQVQSLCVHGDTPGAVGLARAVRTALEEAGVRLAPFAT